MTNFINFLSDHYLLFVIISLFLIFALIGYFVEKKHQKTSPFKITTEKYKSEEIDLNNINVANNVSLSEFVNNNAHVKENNQVSENVNNKNL